jgi:zinc protease
MYRHSAVRHRWARALRHTVLLSSLSTSLLFAFPAQSAPAAAAVAAKPDAQALRIPPIDYRTRTLSNGLLVISAPMHASPTVSVQVWYRVGSKDDPQGRSGFAHLFEHMMFKSTKYMQSEQLDRMTEDVGGSNNAFTADDTTAYHEVVPSNHLERLLWAEAERMAHLNVDEANFKSERAVVEEELRQRVLAEPYGRLFNAISPASYRVHPYKRPGIGNIEELEAASLDDVRSFHSTYYRPDDAVLVVTGDFDQAQLDTWIDRYFGAIKSPAEKIPRVSAVEPARSADARVQITGPNVPLPAVAITWLIPPAADADMPALKIAAALLGAGDSSRLYQSLVYRQQIASSVGIDADPHVDTGLFAAYAVASQGKSIDAVAKALDAEIARLAKQPASAAELDKIRTQLVTGALLERQTPLGLGMALGNAAVIDGDVATVNTQLAALQAVTAADVQRVMRRYITGARKVVIEYRAAAAAPSPKSPS